MSAQMRETTGRQESIRRLRIAIDTNCVIDWSDYQNGLAMNPSAHSKLVYDGLEILLAMAGSGVVTLGISKRFLSDKIKDMEPERKLRHVGDFEALMRRGVQSIQSTFRFAVGWGRFATETDQRLGARVEAVLHPAGIRPGVDPKWLNRQSDVDHLRDAIAAGYSIFVTSDRELLKARVGLCRCGVQVMAVGEAVQLACRGFP